eukprot:5790968-Prymnesium_polylepis.4
MGAPSDQAATGPPRGCPRSTRGEWPAGCGPEGRPGQLEVAFPACELDKLPAGPLYALGREQALGRREITFVAATPRGKYPPIPLSLRHSSPTNRDHESASCDLYPVSSSHSNRVRCNHGVPPGVAFHHDTTPVVLATNAVNGRHARVVHAVEKVIENVVKI